MSDINISDENVYKEKYLEKKSIYERERTDTAKAEMEEVLKQAEKFEELIELGKKNPYDFYSILDLEFGASTNDFKSKIRKMSFKYHPDRNPNDPYARKMIDLLTCIKIFILDSDEKTYYDRNYNRITKFYNPTETGNWVLNDRWSHINMNGVKLEIDSDPFNFYGGGRSQEYPDYNYRRRYDYESNRGRRRNSDEISGNIFLVLILILIFILIVRRKLAKRS